MSEEHRALGYRPPPGSLAAEAQSAASKHPEAAAPLSEEQIRLAALADAERIKSEREKNGVDLSAIGQGAREPFVAADRGGAERSHCAAQASKLMSEEHKALGHRPPPGSLAAQAQAAAAQHPQGASSSQPGAHDLQLAALESAASANIDLDAIGEGTLVPPPTHVMGSVPTSFKQRKPANSCRKNTKRSGIAHHQVRSQQRRKPPPPSILTRAQVSIPRR